MGNEQVVELIHFLSGTKQQARATSPKPQPKFRVDFDFLYHSLSLARRVEADK
jgi:hypothetical protein